MAKGQLRIVRQGEPPGRAAPRPAFDAGNALLDSPALHALLARGLRAIVALTGARGGAIRLVSAGCSEMRLVAAMGLPPEWLAQEQRVTSDCGICGLALQSDRLQLENKPSPCAERLGRFAGESECGPALAVPLHCRGRTLGVFNLFFAGSANLPQDLAALLDPVADMLDLVLENALLENDRLESSLVAERQMFAAEVHDSLAQGLAFMRMRMSLLHDALSQRERERSLKYFNDVNEALGEAHARLRELITHFRHVEQHGLLEALHTTARTFEERTGVALRIDSRVSDLRLPPEQEAEVFQIVQEALANVIKHAGARNARVLIERSPRRLQVSVEDDGCGVGDEAVGASGHYGLEIMRERAQRLGGNLEVRKAPRKGTRVRLVVPAPARVRSGR